MKGYLILLLVVIISGSILANDCYPIEIPNKSFKQSMNATADMKYHNGWYYYWTLKGSDWTLASYFEPERFSVYTSFRIQTIGFTGYVSNGPANIYIFLAEDKNGSPYCTPPDFSNRKYGPYAGHINYTYCIYDDIDVYSQNWCIKKSEIDLQPHKRFWVLYHLPTSPPPYPVSDDATDSKNSLTWDPSRQNWVPDIDIAINSGFVYSPCWCMHIVVEYPPAAIENTSLGTVKSLFK
jgi:hypothetical protein